MSKGMMTTACSLVLLSICVASPNVLAVDETKEDIAKLQGNWRMVS
jgi:hypothetical protein